MSLDEIKGNFELTKLNEGFLLKFGKNGARYSYRVTEIEGKNKKIIDEDVSKYNQKLLVEEEQILYLSARHYRLLVVPIEQLKCEIKEEIEKAGMFFEKSYLFFHVRDFRTFNKDDYKLTAFLYLDKSNIDESVEAKLRSIIDKNFNSAITNSGSLQIRNESESFEVDIPQSMHLMLLNYLNE